LPNTISVSEGRNRYDFDDPRFVNGIAESFSIDQSKHSLFGASKVAADIMVQEYGRYFSMPTCCLRAGCLTGPNHSGVELHGFLSYLVRCNLESIEYKIFGYKGKQVRDNLHSQDVASLMYEIYRRPRIGEVYNVGGGKANSCSILEAFQMVEQITGRKQRYTYLEQPRKGDHICYYTDLAKIRSDFPSWVIRKPLSTILQEIADSWQSRVGNPVTCTV
jgi:CDP-paratose 2-epimerase